MRIYKPEGNTFRKFGGFKIDTLRKYMQDGTIIEAPVSKCDSDLSLHLDLGLNIEGVIPIDELEYNKSGNKPKNVAVVSRVTKPTCFKVINIEEKDGQYKVTLSRKQAQKECYDNYVSKFKVGQIVSCKITHVEEYGAFCDLGCGLIALLPVENFCIARIRDPRRTLSRYKNLKVIIKNIGEDGRILLTQKELLGTWEQEASKFKAGDTVAGKVRLIEDYGVFVELTPNLAGLAEPISDVNVGDTVSVFIKSIVPDKMKIKLLITDHSNPDSKVFMKLHYRIPESGFLYHWVYSPEGAAKVIESHIADPEPETETAKEETDQKETVEKEAKNVSDAKVEDTKTENIDTESDKTDETKSDQSVDSENTEDSKEDDSENQDNQDDKVDIETKAE